MSVVQFVPHKNWGWASTSMVPFRATSGNKRYEARRSRQMRNQPCRNVLQHFRRRSVPSAGATVCSPWRGRQVEKTVGPRKGLSLLTGAVAWVLSVTPLTPLRYETSIINTYSENRVRSRLFDPVRKKCEPGPDGSQRCEPSLGGSHSTPRKKNSHFARIPDSERVKDIGAGSGTPAHGAATL